MLTLLAYRGSGAVGSGSYRISMNIEPLKEKYTYLNSLPQSTPPRSVHCEGLAGGWCGGDVAKRELCNLNLFTDICGKIFIYCVH